MGGIFNSNGELLTPFRFPDLLQKHKPQFSIFIFFIIKTIIGEGGNVGFGKRERFVEAEYKLLNIFTITQSEIAFFV